jgi:hypothetical protein
MAHRENLSPRPTPQGSHILNHRPHVPRARPHERSLGRLPWFNLTTMRKDVSPFESFASLICDPVNVSLPGRA